MCRVRSPPPRPPSRERLRLSVTVVGGCSLAEDVAPRRVDAGRGLRLRVRPWRAPVLYFTPAPVGDAARSQRGGRCDKTHETCAGAADAERCSLLRERMAACGASRVVTAVHSDFLHVAPSDPRFARVTHVLLDPSCSSSGLAGVPDPTPDAAAVAALAAEQRKLVLHAMRFPRFRGCQRAHRVCFFSRQRSSACRSCGVLYKTPHVSCGVL